MSMFLSAADTERGLVSVRERPARRLQLNHPLNYLVVPYLRLLDPALPVLDSLSKYWAHRLGAEGSQKHALNGAYALGLIDSDGETTDIGVAVAQLMRGMGFDVTSAPDRNERLAYASLHLAALARLVLLRMPAVQLVQRVLRMSPGKACFAPDLLYAARTVNITLADDLFLSAVPQSDRLSGADFVNSTVFQFKQVLWHAGILATKAHWSAGKRADLYLPYEDMWGLEDTIMDVHTTSGPKG